MCELSPIVVNGVCFVTVNGTNIIVARTSQCACYARSERRHTHCSLNSFLWVIRTWLLRSLCFMAVFFILVLFLPRQGPLACRHSHGHDWDILQPMGLSMCHWTLMAILFSQKLCMVIWAYGHNFKVGWKFETRSYWTILSVHSAN